MKNFSKNYWRYIHSEGCYVKSEWEDEITAKREGKKSKLQNNKVLSAL